MTDRELLEMAAKAAGYFCVWLYSDQIEPELRVAYSLTDDKVEKWDCMNWQPLHDDGQSLRLAVHLKIRIDPEFHLHADEFGYEKVAAVWMPGDSGDPSFYGFGSDPMEVMRRLIVQAAAKIGRRCHER